VGSLVYSNEAMQALKQLLTSLSVHLCTRDTKLKRKRPPTEAALQHHEQQQLLRREERDTLEAVL
jgi:hypothetical protein